MIIVTTSIWKLRLESPNGHGSTPLAGSASRHRSGGNSTPLLYPLEKLEPTYLSGGFSSTYSWCPPVRVNSEQFVKYKVYSPPCPTKITDFKAYNTVAIASSDRDMLQKV
ncbi:hypothetical protein AVEN_194522-1 [Araneus ventricosus]|uniref:Uncharacterized protein n=1 Tax=Araneus ventricosus TaxID=182803 RepID=A0A4Y2A8Q3_ARAVE|nr:hypothetical protein AVEN_194522-1 [Araneus ventricosus]